MIFAIIGQMCGGQDILTKYLADTYNFKTYDIQEEFYKSIAEVAAPLKPEERLKLFYSSIARFSE